MYYVLHVRTCVNFHVLVKVTLRVNEGVVERIKTHSRVLYQCSRPCPSSVYECSIMMCVLLRTLLTMIINAHIFTSKSANGYESHVHTTKNQQVSGINNCGFYCTSVRTKVQQSVPALYMSRFNRVQVTSAVKYLTQKQEGNNHARFLLQSNISHKFDQPWL